MNWSYLDHVIPIFRLKHEFEIYDVWVFEDALGSEVTLVEDFDDLE